MECDGARGCACDQVWNANAAISHHSSVELGGAVKLRKRTEVAPGSKTELQKECQTSRTHSTDRKGLSH